MVQLEIWGLVEHNDRYIVGMLEPPAHSAGSFVQWGIENLACWSSQMTYIILVSLWCLGQQKADLHGLRLIHHMGAGENI